jgi:hypothetical protein
MIILPTVMMVGCSWQYVSLGLIQTVALSLVPMDYVGFYLFIYVHPFFMMSNW